MIDREKVIKGLECCAAGTSGKCIKECPYDFVNANCTADMARDALELLKEQEAKPVLSERYCETLPNHYERKGFCPKCHQFVEWYLNRSYCGFCGQAVKWE